MDYDLRIRIRASGYQFIKLNDISGLFFKFSSFLPGLMQLNPYVRNL